MKLWQTDCPTNGPTNRSVHRAVSLLINDKTLVNLIHLITREVDNQFSSFWFRDTLVFPSIILLSFTKHSKQVSLYIICLTFIQLQSMIYDLFILNIIEFNYQKQTHLFFLLLGQLHVCSMIHITYPVFGSETSIWLCLSDIWLVGWSVESMVGLSVIIF